MKLEATIVTDERQTVVELSKSNVGQAAVPTPETPALLGALLIQQTEPETDEVASNLTTEEVDRLPNTASSLPLASVPLWDWAPFADVSSSKLKNPENACPSRRRAGVSRFFRLTTIENNQRE